MTISTKPQASWSLRTAASLSANQNCAQIDHVSCNPPHLPCFYWHIVALQFCVSFYCREKWIHHIHVHVYIYMYMYPLFFQIFFPFKSPQSAEQSSMCSTVGSHWWPTLHTVSIVYLRQSQSPNLCHLYLSPLGIHVFVLYISVSISALQIRSSIPFFAEFTYMH